MLKKYNCAVKELFNRDFIKSVKPQRTEALLTPYEKYTHHKCTTTFQISMLKIVKTLKIWCFYLVKALGNV